MLAHLKACLRLKEAACFQTARRRTFHRGKHRGFAPFSHLLDSGSSPFDTLVNRRMCTLNRLHTDKESFNCRKYQCIPNRMGFA